MWRNRCQGTGVKEQCQRFLGVNEWSVESLFGCCTEKILKKLSTFFCWFGFQYSVRSHIPWSLSASSNANLKPSSVHLGVQNIVPWLEASICSGGIGFILEHNWNDWYIIIWRPYISENASPVASAWPSFHWGSSVARVWYNFRCTSIDAGGNWIHFHTIHAKFRQHKMKKLLNCLQKKVLFWYQSRHPLSSTSSREGELVRGWRWRRLWDRKSVM